MIFTVLFLLSLALFSMFALHQKKHTEDSIQEILGNYSVGQIYTEYQSHNRTLWGFFVAGVLLTAGFALTYFSGKDLKFATWGTEQYMFAFVGLAVTLTITNGQRLLYQNVNTHTVAFAVTVVILVFVYMSEISTQGERSEMLMKERSKDSPTLSATLDALRNQVQHQNSSTSPYSSFIAEAERLASEHQSKLAECETKYSTEKRRAKCREYERAKMAGYQQQAQSYKTQSQDSKSQSSGTIATLIENGRQLENNEENYPAFIKFTKSFFAVSSISALTFVGFILVNAFEVLFHYIGVRTGILREALLRNGYNLDPEPPTPDDINAKTKYKREIQRAKWTEKTRDYARKLERKNRGNRTTPPPFSDHTEGTNQTVPETAPKRTGSDTPSRTGDRSQEKKRKHTELAEPKAGTDTSTAKPPDHTDQIRTTGKEKVWFPEVLYRAVRRAILDQSIKPTIRPAHTMVSEGLREGLQDETGKHRHYTKPETQEITVFILEKLEEERVLLPNTEGGIGKAKYKLNTNHPETI